MNLTPDLTIVLLGNSGVGKSASGNTILGRTAFESKLSSSRVTTEISEVHGTVFRKRISVIDTPGIFGSEGLIQNKCQQLLESNRPCLFLLVIEIHRFTIEQKNAAEAAIRVIGDEGFENCFLLFTGADRLGSKKLDEFINEDPEGPLKEVVNRFGGRVHLFNNSNGGPEQVRDLLVKSGHLQEDVGPAVERRVVLLGLPGAGKSATGNTILGSQQFKSACGFNPVTTETVSRSARVEGRQLTVVDTPGFSCERLSPRKLFDEIMSSIQEAQPGPHAFIILVPLERISPIYILMFELLEKLFGKHALKYAMVVFTHGDKLEGQSMDGLIQANKDMKDLVSKCGGRFCVFDNTQRANRVQVGDLLDKIDKMVAANNGEHYTSEMFKDIQSFLVTLSIKWQEIREWFIRKLREIDAAREAMARRRGRNDAEAQGFLSEIN